MSWRFNSGAGGGGGGGGSAHAPSTTRYLQFNDDEMDDSDPFSAMGASRVPMTRAAKHRAPRQQQQQQPMTSGGALNRIQELQGDAYVDEDVYSDQEADDVKKDSKSNPYADLGLPPLSTGSGATTTKPKSQASNMDALLGKFGRSQTVANQRADTTDPFAASSSRHSDPYMAMDVDDAASEDDMGDFDDGPDSYFINSVTALLQDVEPELKEEDFLPMHHVASILCSEDASDVPTSEADAQARLDEFIYLQEDADRILKDYVVEHYEGFNQNIKEFSDIIVTLSSSEGTITSIKHSIGVGTALLATHTPELRRLQARLEKNKILRAIAEAVMQCVDLQHDCSRLLDQRHYAAAYKHLLQCNELLDKPHVRDLGALAHVRSYVDTTLTSLHHTVIHDAVNVVFLRGGRYSLANRELFVVGEDPIGSVAATLHVDSATRGFLHSCLETLQWLGKSFDAQSAIMDHSKKYVERIMVEHINKHCEGAMGSADMAVVARDGMAVGHNERLAGFLRSLLRKLERVMRNIGYCALIAATVDFPFIRKMDKKTFDNYQEWDMGEQPLPGDLVSKILKETQLITTLGNEGAAEVAVSAIWVKFNHAMQRNAEGGIGDRLGSPTTTAGSSEGALSTTLSTMKGHLEAGRDSLIEAGTIPAAAIEDCHDIVVDQLTTSVRQHVHQTVQNALQRWDVSVAWTEMNAHLEVLCGLLCGCDPVTMQTTTQPTRTRKAGGWRARLQSGGHHRRVSSGGAGGGGGANFVPAVVTEVRSLSNLLSTTKEGHLKLLDDVGTVQYSLESTARRLQRSRAAQEVENTSMAGAPTLAHHDDTEEVRSPAIRELMPAVYGVFGCHVGHALVCFAECHAFVQRVNTALPRLGTAARNTVATLQETIITTRWVPLLQEQQRSILEQRYGAGGGHARFGEDVLSTKKASLLAQSTRVRSEAGSCVYPVLTGAMFVRDAIQRATTCGRLCKELVDFFTVNLSCDAIERLLLSLKHEMQAVSKGTMAWHLVGPLFQGAFLHSASPRWQVMFDEDNLYGSMLFIDSELFKYYDAANQQRATSARAVSAESVEAAAAEAIERTLGVGDYNADGIDVKVLGKQSVESLRIKRDGISVLGAIAHTAEWLSKQCLPGDVLSKEDGLVPPNMPVNSSTEGLNARFVALHYQLVTVTRAALALLAVDARFIVFGYLPQLRDENYNVAACSDHPDPYIKAYTEDLGGYFRSLERQLPSNRRKYIALTLARPIPDLLLNELSQLRDRRISPSGRLQLQVDVSAMQTAVQLLLPGEEETSNACRDYFSKAAGFVALLNNRNVVEELAAGGWAKKLTALDMENLVSLVFRVHHDDQDAVFKHITELRQRLASADEEERSMEEGKVQPLPSIEVRGNDKSGGVGSGSFAGAAADAAKKAPLQGLKQMALNIPTPQQALPQSTPLPPPPQEAPPTGALPADDSSSSTGSIRFHPSAEEDEESEYTDEEYTEEEDEYTEETETDDD